LIRAAASTPPLAASSSLLVSAWIGIIGTVIGALLAGSAAWLNSRLQLHSQEKRERKKLFLSKLEELYELVAQFKRSCEMSAAPQEPINVSDIPPLPIEKLQMLIGLYAPELEFLLGQLFLRHEEFGAALIGGVHHDTRHDFLGNIVGTSTLLNQTCEQLQREIVSLSKKFI
jgi:hypothetical protein